MNSLVIHPEHYNEKGKPECWDCMETFFGKDAVIIFDVLSAYKYLYRKGLKPGNSVEQDTAKIENYMNHANMLIASKDDADGLPEMIYKTMESILKESEE